jgi:hypothetical protein
MKYLWHDTDREYLKRSEKKLVTFSSYRAVNTHRLGYKNQPVNAVLEAIALCPEIQAKKTKVLSVGRKKFFEDTGYSTAYFSKYVFVFLPHEDRIKRPKRVAT